MATMDEIRKAVIDEMAAAARDVEALTYAEIYDFDDAEIEEACKLQASATVVIVFPGDLD